MQRTTRPHSRLHSIDAPPRRTSPAYRHRPRARYVPRGRSAAREHGPPRPPIRGLEISSRRDRGNFVASGDCRTASRCPVRPGPNAPSLGKAAFGWSRDAHGPHHRNTRRRRSHPLCITPTPLTHPIHLSNQVGVMGVLGDVNTTPTGPKRAKGKNKTPLKSPHSGPVGVLSPNNDALEKRRSKLQRQLSETQRRSFTEALDEFHQSPLGKSPLLSKSPLSRQTSTLSRSSSIASKHSSHPPKRPAILSAESVLNLYSNCIKVRNCISQIQRLFAFT
jgi:hypothetical protein